MASILHDPPNDAAPLKPIGNEPVEHVPVETSSGGGDFFPSVEGEYERPRPPRRRRMWWAVGLLALAAVVGVIVWRSASGPATPSLQFARLESGQIDHTVSTTGTLNPVVTVQVGSQVSGNIKALYADFNSHVTAGELVAEIDPAPFQAVVDQAEASLNAAQAAVVTAQANVTKANSDVASSVANVANQQANLKKAQSAAQLAKTESDRQQALLQAKVIALQDQQTAEANYQQALAGVDAAQASVTAAQATSESSRQEVDVAQTQVKQAQAVVRQDQAQLSQAQLNLSHTRIVAPVTGTVIARNMDVGQTVAASFQAPTIFQIAQDLTKMQVDTNVAEADVANLQVGQTASFTVDAFPSTVFHGTVSQIRKAPINVQNVITYDAVIAVPNPDLKLFPGMTANVTVLVERKNNVLKIPNAALRVKPPASLVVNQEPQPGQATAAANQQTVYVAAADDKLRAVPVTTGITDGVSTELVSGDLQQSEQVAVGVSTPSAAAPASSRSQRDLRRF
jgi:HlyD family secretion protein